MPDLGAQGEIFRYSVLRGGCPDGVMLDEHDLQLVMFFVQRYSALYRVTGLLVGATQADKQF